MAGLKTTVDRLFTNRWRGDLLRAFMQPGIATGIGVQLAAGGALTFGNWTDLALAAAITQDTLVVGIEVDTPSAGEVFTVDLGSCMANGVIYANAAAVIAAGGAAIAAAHRQETRVEIATDAGGYVPVYLPNPIFIPAGVGVIGRMYNVGGAQTIRVGVICLQNF